MNTMFDIVKSLRPHFFSLREIEENISLDIKIPSNWKYEKMLAPKKDLPFAVKVQDQKKTNSLISLIALATAEGYDFVFEYAEAVISINKEEEEKEKLFKEKVGELKSLFLSSPLDKLKDISFDDELSNTESSGEIKLGDEKGRAGDEQSKTKTD